MYKRQIYIYGTVNIFCSAMDINELVRMYSDEVEMIKYDNESAATLEAAGLNTEGSSVNHTHEFAKDSEMEELPIDVYKRQGKYIPLQRNVMRKLY